MLKHYFLITSIALATIFVGVFNAYAFIKDVQPALFLENEDLRINEELVNINDLQNTLFTEKYTYIPEYTKDNISYTVHEYVNPQGLIGYQTIVNDNTYLISTATGVEKEARTFKILLSDLEND